MERGHACDYCKRPFDGNPWVLLNRAVFGSGQAYAMSSFESDDGYVWEQSMDPPDYEDHASGVVLCFPQCLQTFIEGRMLEAEIECGRE